MPAPRSRPLRLATLLLAVAALAACGSAGASDDQPTGTIGGVGVLPDQTATSAVPTTVAVDGSTAATPPGNASSGAPNVVTATGGSVVPIAERVSGNKLLMIGDSIFAGAASRYGNEACNTLVPLDWQVDVEAESGRAIDFGERVVRQMVPQGWDVIVFFLGTNYGGNEVGYREYLVKALDEIGPDTPVVLLTTTVYATKQNEVNTIIHEEAATRPNVSVLDWATLSEAPGMLSGDGYHPSDQGRQTMMDAVALLVGKAPVAPGKCLQSKNRSDAPNTPGAPTTAPKGRGGTGSGSGSGSGSDSGTTTTKAPVTNAPAATTVPATSAATRPPAATTPATAAPTAAPTQAPTTQAPATPAPTTDPEPPPTQPTSPPTPPPVTEGP
jgi:GDSL-like lipase/acylhydrolase family protein